MADLAPAVGRNAGPIPWSFRVGRVAGVNLYVHGTFLLLLAWIAFGDLVRGAAPATMFAGLALVLAVFGSVVLHELGHALVARRFGIRTRAITLLPIGGVASLEKLPEKPVHELLVAAAGPAVNVAIAALLGLALVAVDGPVLPPELALETAGFLTKLLAVNLSLAVFNLLPAFPLDGGRMLRALVWSWTGFLKATRVAAAVGAGMAALFAVIGLFYNPMLVVIAFFVWFGGQVELAGARVKAALAGVRVGAAASAELEDTYPSEALWRLADRLVARPGSVFFVRGAAGISHVLTAADVHKALGDFGPAGTVGAAAGSTYVVAAPGDELEPTFSRMRDGGAALVVVVDRGAVVGVVTPQNVSEVVRIRSALELWSDRGLGVRRRLAPTIS